MMMCFSSALVLFISGIFTKKSTPETLDELRSEAVELYSQEQTYSIALHYIAGRIKLEARPHEFNMDLNNTLLNFYDARNWDVVRFIAEMIISKSSNPVAYRVLGDVEHEDGNDGKMWSLYEHYAVSDAKDREIIIRVGNHIAESGDLKKAASFLERGLLRQVLPEDRERAVAVFSRLIEIGKTDFPFLNRYIIESKDRDSETAKRCGKLLKENLDKAYNALKAEGGRDSEEDKTLSDIILVLSEILSSEPFVSAREGMFNRKVTLPLCQRCSYRTRFD